MMKRIYILAIILVLYCSGSNAELCESITVSGTKQAAFACPRLYEANDLTYCCGNESVLLECCNDMNESVYRHSKENNLKHTPTHYNISISIVAIYALLLVVFCIVDSISHFGRRKKRNNGVM